MASKTRKLRAAMKAILDPAFEQAGFTVDYPNYRRDRRDTLDVVGVQHWKEGGAFILNAARYADLDQLPVPREKIQIGMVPALRQERIGPVKSQVMEKLVGWFKFADISDDTEALNEMMTSAASLIPQIEAWLEDGTLGPNIDPENSRLADT